MHLGLVLDQQLNFIDHIQNKTTKCCKIIAIIKRLSVNIPRDALLRIINHLTDPIWTVEMLFMTNLTTSHLIIQNIQYKACITITGAN